MKLKKKIPLIDQHDKSGFWGGKFGGNFIPETLKKPVQDLTLLFEKLRYDKKFLQQRDYYFKNYIGSPTSFIKLENYKEIADIIDISGGLETSGLKDFSKINIFLNKIKQINDET